MQALLDGEATDGDARRLQEALRNDPGARRMWLDYAALHQALDYRFPRAPAVPGRRASLVEGSLRRQRRRMVALSLAAACAALVVFALLLRLFLVPERPPAAAFRTAPQSLWSVTHAEGQKRKEGGLSPGSRVRLDQGTLELDFAGGTRAVLLGPADFTVEDEGTLRLGSGTGWFLVPEKDVGFRVMTPELGVLDLGTEFGVIADPADQDEVHVFSGRVEVTARTGRKEKRMVAGVGALRVDPAGRLREIAPRGEDFLRSLPDGLPSIRFAFDGEMDGRIEVSGNHPAAGRIRAELESSGDHPRVVPGVSGGALEFDGRGGHVVTDWPGISGIGPRTVTFWVRVDPAADLTGHPGMVGWGDPRMPNGKWKLLLTQETPGAPAYPRISIGGHAYDAPAAANDGRWHHLAMSFTGRMGDDGHPELAIHFDGERQPLIHRHFPEPGGPRTPDTRTEFGALPMSIGGPVDPWPGSFVGRIDELKIYPGVLPEEEIRSQAAEFPR